VPLAVKSPGGVGKEEIEAWLISKIAQKVSINPRRVERHQPFSSFGIDSIAAVSLVGDMEEWTGCRLSPTLMYDYPNIEALASHLATELGA
jgi:acyl carrier protein